MMKAHGKSKCRCVAMLLLTLHGRASAQSESSFRLVTRILRKKYGGFPKLGNLFGGPHTKDSNIWGSILGSPYFGKLPSILIPSRLLGMRWLHGTEPFNGLNKQEPTCSPLGAHQGLEAWSSETGIWVRRTCPSVGSPLCSLLSKESQLPGTGRACCVPWFRCLLP